MTIRLAIFDIYVLDFVINIAQATCRALVVDALPVEKQQTGGAWITRMVGLGHILVFGFGALDLNYWLPPMLGDTQFKKVCAFAAFMMVFTFSVNCWAVTEKVLVSDPRSPTDSDQSLLAIIKQIYSRALHVPQRIQYICNVQFWSWIGWFPLMVGMILPRDPTFADDFSSTAVPGWEKSTCGTVSMAFLHHQRTR